MRVSRWMPQPRLPQFVDAHESRAGHQGDRGNLVVGGEKILEFVGRVACASKASRKASDHPRGASNAHPGISPTFDSGQCGLRARHPPRGGIERWTALTKRNRTIGQVGLRATPTVADTAAQGTHTEELVCAHTSQDQNTRIQVS